MKMREISRGKDKELSVNNNLFLNVERVSMPDIDSDFKIDIRAKVVDYCRAKYGKECICQIMTKSYGATKGNLRLAARYLGSKEFEEINGETGREEVDTANEKEVEEAKLQMAEEINAISGEESETEVEIPENVPVLKDSERLKLHLKPWYNRADKLSKLYGTYEELKQGSSFSLSFDEYIKQENCDDVDIKLVQYAELLDGVFTGYGQHAAGTIISGDDVTDVLPLMWNSKKGSMETQCTMAQAESKGLLKMDFLGLQNLDIITDIISHPTFEKDMDDTLQNYKKRDAMLKDSTIYRKIFWTGLTQGIFQFESPGMKKMLMDFKPDCFEDIILLVAAYRPGPMQYLDSIIAQKKYRDGRSKEKPVPKIDINNEALQKIISPTYGCIIYQEQVMQIFQNLAGYSLGGADLVRRAMSKKHLEDLIPEREAFLFGDESRGIEGCIKKQGLTEAEGNMLFDQMMDFAAYAFNKSHATAYAMVAMFTAYLKVYHTKDFFRSSLNAIKELKEIPPFVAEMKEFDITLKRPDLIKSDNKFMVDREDGNILYGLKYIKGFSEQNVSRQVNVQSFIESNPSVSLKTIKKYAQLGMFRGCWKADGSTTVPGYSNRLNVGSNRHEILRWIDESAPLLIKYLAQVEKTDTLTTQYNNLLNTFLETQSQELRKEIEQLHKKLEKELRIRTELAGTLMEIREADKIATIPMETPDQVLENRKVEAEMLSMPFSIEDSLNRVKASANKKTFSSLSCSKDENDGYDKIYVPAVVLMVSDAKKTKSSGNVYYEVTLMDRERNIITRRFDTPPVVLDGEFQLTLDECKYYLCKTEKRKELVDNARNIKRPILSTSSTQDKIKSIKNGNFPEMFNLGDGNITSVYHYEEDGVER